MSCARPVIENPIANTNAITGLRITVIPQTPHIYIDLWLDHQTGPTPCEPR
jgi:hypothetical protein